MDGSVILSAKVLRAYFGFSFTIPILDLVTSGWEETEVDDWAIFLSIVGYVREASWVSGSEVFAISWGKDMLGLDEHDGCDLVMSIFELTFNGKNLV